MHAVFDSCGSLESTGGRFRFRHTEQKQKRAEVACYKMNIGHPVSKSKFRTLVKVNLGRRTSQ
jgi:hypothetical protein